MIMVFMEAMASAREDDVRAASKVLRMILKSSMPEIGKVAASRARRGPRLGQGLFPSVLFWSHSASCWLGFTESPSFNPEEKRFDEEGFFLPL